MAGKKVLSRKRATAGRRGQGNSPRLAAVVEHVDAADAQRLMMLDPLHSSTWYEVMCEVMTGCSRTLGKVRRKCLRTSAGSHQWEHLATSMRV